MVSISGCSGAIPGSDLKVKTSDNAGIGHASPSRITPIMHRLQSNSNR